MSRERYKGESVRTVGEIRVCLKCWLRNSLANIDECRCPRYKGESR